MATGAGTGTAAAGAGTTLSDLKTICYYHGWQDQSTTGVAALMNFINRTLQLLSMLAPWPEYHKRDGRIELNQFSGDVSGDFADAGSGKVTVTSATHGLSNDFYVTITDTTNYDGSYWIGDVATNTFTIIATYVAETTAGSWTCNQDIYACTNNAGTTIDNIDKLGDVYRTDRTSPLDMMSGGINEWLRKIKTARRTGAPLEYALRKYVSTGKGRTEMLVYPAPGSGQDGKFLYYPYYILPTLLTDDSTVTDWPDSRLWLLEEALERRIASGKRDNLGVALEAPEFMQYVQKAMASSRPSYMPVRMTSHIDMPNMGIRDILPTITS